MSRSAETDGLSADARGVAVELGVATLELLQVEMVGPKSLEWCLLRVRQMAIARRLQAATTNVIDLTDRRSA